MSSCYSEFAGRIFANAGVNHVICIKYGERISDKASIIFAKVFYKTLFTESQTVCSAFEIAKA